MLSSLWFTSIFYLYLMLSFKSREFGVGKKSENRRSQKYFHNFGREHDVTRYLRWFSQKLERKTKVTSKKGCGVVEWIHLCQVGSERRNVVKTVINFQFLRGGEYLQTACRLLTSHKQLSFMEWVLTCTIFKARNDLNMFNSIHFTA